MFSTGVVGPPIRALELSIVTAASSMVVLSEAETVVECTSSFCLMTGLMMSGGRVVEVLVLELVLDVEVEVEVDKDVELLVDDDELVELVLVD